MLALIREVVFYIWFQIFYIVIVYPTEVVFVKAWATIVVSIDDKPSNANKDNELNSVQFTNTQKNELNKGTFLVYGEAYQMQWFRSQFI